MKRVLVIQAQVKEYRVPFFNSLRARLLRDGIELRVAYSDPPPSERGKGDNVDLPFEYGVKVNCSWLFNERVIWQSVFKEAKQADMLVLEYANKYVANHFLKTVAPLRGQKTAFWGLGENKQANRLALSEWYKRRCINSVDWWFAYTKGTAHYLLDAGVPASKITPVQNAIDTRELSSGVQAISSNQRIELRRQLGIGADDLVGIYCGMLDPVKGLRLLLEACNLVQSRLANFHLLIVGGGPERQTVEELSRVHPWVHYLGPKFGDEKARALAISEVFLLPGRVGLAVLDAFAAGLPVVATRLPIHGPEFEFLEDGVNAVLTENDATHYAAKMEDLLTDDGLLQRLGQGGRQLAQHYSIEQMVENFRTGLTACLGTERKFVTQTA